MKINVKCTGCDRTLALSADYAGKRIRCPMCKEIVIVPEPEREPAPEPTTEPRRLPKRPAKKKATPKPRPEPPPSEPESTAAPPTHPAVRFAIGALVGAVLATVIVVIAWAAKRKTDASPSADATVAAPENPNAGTK